MILCRLRFGFRILFFAGEPPAVPIAAGPVALKSKNYKSLVLDRIGLGSRRSVLNICRGLLACIEIQFGFQHVLLVVTFSVNKLYERWVLGNIYSLLLMGFGLSSAQVLLIFTYPSGRGVVHGMHDN